MRIGIDARSLEEGRTGVGRYLLNILERWGCVGGYRFVLYFKGEIPSIGILERPCFEKKIIAGRLGIKSNFYFQHFLLPEAAKKDNIDVLFSPSYILPWGWQGKSVVTIHDVSYEAYPEQVSFINNLLLGRTSRHSAEKANLILTVSEFSKQEIIKYYGINPEKIIMTPPGIDEKFQKINSDKNMDFAKNKYGLAGDYIIAVGSIFNRRHLPETIAAFLRIAEKNSKAQLLIVGKNHTYPRIDIDKIIKEANDKIKRPAIIRVDHIEDGELLWLYNGAKLSIYLSDYEGFGLPPLESAACGVPAIVSDIPAEREVMGEAAIYVRDNKDAGEISGKIILGLFDEKARNILIKAGFERIKKYSWKKCADKTLEAIIGLR